MKIKILTILILIIFTGTAIAFDNMQTPESVSAPQSSSQKVRYVSKSVKAPRIDFQTLNGLSYRLNEMNENGYLLHFWASWCATCIVEFPALFEQVQKRNGEIALIAISIDNKKSDMINMKNRIKRILGAEVDLPNIYWVWDQDKLISYNQMNVTKVPETFLITKNGYIRSKITGQADWNSKEINQQIDLLLDNESFNPFNSQH